MSYPIHNSILVLPTITTVFIATPTSFVVFYDFKTEDMLLSLLEIKMYSG